MPDREIVVPFLGTRRYLQLASVAGAVLPLTEGADATTIKFSRQLRSNHLRLTWQSELEDAPASCCFTRSGSEVRIAIFECDLETPRLAVPYPEAEIVDGWQECDGRAMLNGGKGASSLVERVVALNKAFLLKRFPIGPAEQYMATRWEVRGPSPGVGRLEIEHVRIIAGKHHLSRVVQDGRQIGMIYFARQPLAT